VRRTIRREYKEDSIKDCRADGEKGEDSVEEFIRASAKIFKTKFFRMNKTETTIALNWRTDTRGDFKNHVEYSNMLRQSVRDKFQFNHASGSNTTILVG
jgi:hypothetical protein